jgi:hypothetical protein
VGHPVVKQVMIAIKLMLKVQKEVKSGFSYLLNSVAGGVKFEIEKSQEFVLPEMSKLLNVNKVEIVRLECFDKQEKNHVDIMGKVNAM